jgi:hypothetical protein
VNALGASRYYRMGRGEVDVVLGDGEIAVEVKVSPDAGDIARLVRVAERIGARRKVVVSLSGGVSYGGVETVPAYALEWEMPRLEEEHGRNSKARAG